MYVSGHTPQYLAIYGKYCNKYLALKEMTG